MDIEIKEVQEIIKNLESSGELSIKEEKYLKVAKLCVQLDIRAGDRFETVYPFIFVCTDHQQWDGNVFTDERWIGGCRKTFEPADCGYGDQAVYTADAEGKRILEVLSVAEMPGKWQRRIIYACHLIDPEGKERKGRKAYTVTEDRFIKMSSGYFADYGVENIDD